MASKCEAAPQVLVTTPHSFDPESDKTVETPSLGQNQGPFPLTSVTKSIQPCFFSGSVIQRKNG